MFGSIWTFLVGLVSALKPLFEWLNRRAVEHKEEERDDEITEIDEAVGGRDDDAASAVLDDILRRLPDDGEICPRIEQGVLPEGGGDPDDEGD